MTILDQNLRSMILARLEPELPQELTDALAKLASVDTDASLTAEAAINGMVADSLERAFVYGWQCRENPSSLVISADC